MGYGIGRVPADVDQGGEAIAELDAEQKNGEQMLTWAELRDRHIRTTWSCLGSGCDSREFDPEVYYSNTMGCAVMCRKCYLAYHQASSVQEVVGRANWANRPQPCNRCGKTGQWNRSAGEPLCERHWENY